MESPTNLKRLATSLAAALCITAGSIAIIPAQDQADDGSEQPRVILEVQGLHYDAGMAVRVRVTVRNNGESSTGNPLANPIASGFRLSGPDGKTWQPEKVGKGSAETQPRRLEAHSYFGQVIDLAGHFPILAEIGDYQLTYAAGEHQVESVRLNIIQAFNETSSYKAVIKTAQGDLTLQLFREDAPITVRNFVDLARQGFYDGLTFHYVRPGDILMGGAPGNDGGGGSGFAVPAEFNNRQHLAGTVAMVRGTDLDSASSQFYICLTPQPERDGRFTVFAQIIQGMDILDQLSRTPTSGTSEKPYFRPLEPLVMESITIQETAADQAAGS
jgi:peptidylprolyl isomerase/peptidyl-prolyl cis-trans isomerase B (cyclophilin B)